MNYGPIDRRHPVLKLAITVAMILLSKKHKFPDVLN